MKMKEPFFSITIPAFKGKFLKDAIDSCLEQTYGRFEIIIVDDSSPEDLVSIVNTIHDERIHFYRNKKNFGAVDVVDNWNKCLEYCSGDYIICMGDDDRLSPCCLAEYAKLIERYLECQVFHAWTEMIDENNQPISIQSPRPEWESAYSLAWNRLKGRMQYIGDFCYEITSLRERGGFYKLPLAWASDDISAILGAKQAGIANTPVVCFQYRINRYTISNSGNLHLKLDALSLEKDWYCKNQDNLYITQIPHFLLDMYSDKQILGPEKDYHVHLLNEIPAHFEAKISCMMVEDVKSKFSNINFWWKNQKKHQLSTKRMLKSVFEAITGSMK